MVMVNVLFEVHGNFWVVMLDLIVVIRIIFESLQATFRMLVLLFFVSGNGRIKSMVITSHLDSGGSIGCSRPYGS